MIGPVVLVVSLSVAGASCATADIYRLDVFLVSTLFFFLGLYDGCMIFTGRRISVMFTHPLTDLGHRWRAFHVVMCVFLCGFAVYLPWIGRD